MIDVQHLREIFCEKLKAAGDMDKAFTKAETGVRMLNFANRIQEYVVRRAARALRASALLESAQVKALAAEKDRLILRLMAANKTAASGALSASLTHELAQPLTASPTQAMQSPSPAPPSALTTAKMSPAPVASHSAACRSTTATIL